MAICPCIIFFFLFPILTLTSTPLPTAGQPQLHHSLCSLQTSLPTLSDLLTEVWCFPQCRHHSLSPVLEFIGKISIIFWMMNGWDLLFLMMIFHYLWVVIWDSTLWSHSLVLYSEKLGALGLDIKKEIGP